MALNIFTGSTTANWGSTSSWTLNRIPTSTDLDTAYFGPISPTCSVNVVGAPCYNFDCSTYIRQIQMAQNLSIYGTYSNFGNSASIRFSASSGPGSTITYFNATCSITSNNYVFKREMFTTLGQQGIIFFSAPGSGAIITLLDQFEATAVQISPNSGVPTLTLNGATFSVRESFTVANNVTLKGSNIQIKATASTTTTTFTTNITPMSNNIYINTPGSVTIATLYILPLNNTTQTLKWISGTVNNGGSLVVVANSGTLNLDWSPTHTWATFQLNSVATTGLTSSIVTTQPINATILTLAQSGAGGSYNNYITGGFTCSIFNYTRSIASDSSILWISPTYSHYINGTYNSYVTSTATNTFNRINSIVPGTRAPLIVSYNTNQFLWNCYFTDIDASNGSTILPYLVTATLSNTLNILDLKKNTIINSNQFYTN